MAEATFSLDLHVLGPPLTFALSQDQTLHRKFEPTLRRLVADVPGGKSASDVEWFLTDRNPQSSNWLAIQFSETDPRATDVFSRFPDEVRRGMLLIRGAVVPVNRV